MKLVTAAAFIIGAQSLCDPAEAQPRQQAIEDARAAVKERWESMGQTIGEMQVGFRCGLFDDLSRQTSIMSIENSMQSELIRFGLIGDPTMGIKDFALIWIRKGNALVETGACNRLTPADRGNIRARAATLMAQ